MVSVVVGVVEGGAIVTSAFQSGFLHLEKRVWRCRGERGVALGRSTRTGAVGGGKGSGLQQGEKREERRKWR